MVKKYFIDNSPYDTDDINKIVGYLRTTGIFGDITDCLKVTAGAGTTANIANGIGWVEGCGIEAKDGDTTVVLPSEAGIYSIIMKIDKDGDTVNDIKFDWESGQVAGNHVLAWVTVSGGAITLVTDKRVNSTFNGATQLSPSYNSDIVTYNETLEVTTTKLINIGAGYSHGRAVIYKNDSKVGINVWFNTDKEKTHVMGTRSRTTAATISYSWTKGGVGKVAGVFLFQGSTWSLGFSDLEIYDFYIDGNNIKLDVKGTFNYTIEWEVWQ